MTTDWTATKLKVDENAPLEIDPDITPADQAAIDEWLAESIKESDGGGTSVASLPAVPTETTGHPHP